MFCRPLIIILMLCCAIPPFSGCSNALEPEKTPQRVVIDFLKESGRRDYEMAGEYVTAGSRDRIEQWARSLFFPDVSNPATPEEGQNIDKFIGNFYRVTTDDETQTQARVTLIWSATDALIGFPSVSENPMVPTSAMFEILLERTDGSTDGEMGSWMISNFGPMPMSH